MKLPRVGPASQAKRGARLLAILLDARRAQAVKAMLINRGLPGEEFLDRECIARTGLFEGQQAATHRENT